MNPLEEPTETISAGSVAAQGVATILRSEAMSAIWRRHYRSKGDAPLHELATELETHKNELEAHPDLKRLTHEIISIEAGALGPPQVDEPAQITRVRAQLSSVVNGMAGTVSRAEAIEKEAARIAREEARKSQSSAQRVKSFFGFGHTDKEQEEKRDTIEKITKMLRKETAQVPFTPVKSSARFLKDWAKHFFEEMGEHKIGSSILFAASVGAFKFMNMRLPPSSRVRITPQETSITNLSLDSLDGTEPLTFDPSLIRTDIAPTCHDHIQQLTGSKEVADFLRNAMTIGDTSLFPQDCTQMNTIAWDAQAKMQQGFNFMNERLAWFTEDRVMDVSRALPDSHFLQAFVQGAHDMAVNVYTFDAIENFTFHVGLLAASTYMAHKYNSMGDEEVREKWDGIKNFFNRTARNNYLAYAFAATAAAGYIASGAPHADVGTFWLGTLGAVAGNAIHKRGKTKARQEHVLALTQNLPVTDSMSAESIPAVVGAEEASTPSSSRKQIILGAAFAAVAGAVALVGADAAGQLDAISNPVLRDNLIWLSSAFGSAAAKGLVTGSYLAVNVPQDSFLHVIFAMVGGTVGTITGNTQKLIERVAFRKKDNNDKSKPPPNTAEMPIHDARPEHTN